MELELDHFGPRSMLTCSQARGEMEWVTTRGLQDMEFGTPGKKTTD